MRRRKLLFRYRCITKKEFSLYEKIGVEKFKSSKENVFYVPKEEKLSIFGQLDLLFVYYNSEKLYLFYCASYKRKNRNLNGRS